VNLVYLAEACALLRWMMQDDVEHLHAHFGTNPTAVAMLCRALGGPPYSFTVHGPGEFDRATVLALDRKIANARFVVAISQFGRSQLYRWADYKDWPKIQVVHCGLNDSFIDAPHTELPDTPRLVCVGRLCEQKGQLLLIEAAAKLHREGVDFALTLVGDGEMRSACEQLIRRHHLTERVTITGWASADQVRRQLIDARALVLPSFAEGLPVVIMEALALGRPVISTYVAGIPELVRPGECGWLVPAGDIDALATAMRDALSRDVDELTQMGAAGRTLAQREHNVHVEAAKLLQLFSTGPTSNTAEEESPDGDSHALNRTTLMESTT
jgi:glycosyltransferase involved in cell wall biosynthesis